MSASIYRMLRAVDYEMLRTQRQELHAAAEGKVHDKHALDGLSNLLDSLVDAAIEDRIPGADEALLTAASHHYYTVVVDGGNDASIVGPFRTRRKRSRTHQQADEESPDDDTRSFFLNVLVLEDGTPVVMVEDAR